MLKTVCKSLSLCLLLVANFAVATPTSTTQFQYPHVIIETNLGSMRFELFTDVAPNTVANFKRLIAENWYQDKQFYRVVAGHVIQAGSQEDNEQATVKAEFNTRPHVKGTLGLARSADPDSGSTEIYICHQPRPHLDGKYTVFGQLFAGVEVLDAIATTEVDEKWIGDDNSVAYHSPKNAIVIKSIQWIDADELVDSM